MIDLSVLMLTVFYAGFGVLLMIVSNIVIDCFIPGDFAEEILRAVIMSSACETMPADFVQGVVASAVYAAVGILCFIAGFFVINAWHRKYKLAAEIQRGNTAAGIFVFGVFVGLSLVISGAVH